VVSAEHTSIIFADLRDALQELDAARGSPKEVRRAFSRFADLTQRLTAAMRKDYSELKGEHWRAASFPGWNDVTNFFKWLRNQDQHGVPIRISVHERHFYPLPGRPGEAFPFEGTWTLEDQLADTPPQGAITFNPVDPSTGATLDPVPPLRIEYQYLVQLSSEALRKRLQTIGTTDMHLLCARCFETLVWYHEYFLAKLGA
jgi:hypothetical protein